jgi:2-oxoisovalerate dehydrogenase E1 component
MGVSEARAPAGRQVESPIDWRRVLYLTLASRALDDIEETRLVPQGKVLYQFSARGHDMAQIILGTLLDHPHDAVGAYYRSRPTLLTLGLSLEDALAAPMGKSGGFSNGRDIGVVCNLPNTSGAIVLPMSGDVGSQYTPAAGWAQGILYHRDVLADRTYDGSIAVVLGGEASVATNGFWSALTIATTLSLPLLFYIEDNGYGISVPASFQTPGGDIAANLAGFRNLQVSSGDGTEPVQAAALLQEAVAHVRAGKGPALLRLTVPRLSGHSAQDTQAYKGKERLTQEQASDPLPKLYDFLRSGALAPSEISAIESQAKADVDAALEAALARPDPSPSDVTRYVRTETRADGSPDLQMVGGLAPSGHRFPQGTNVARPEPARINLLTAIRRTLEHELASNPRMLLFGEDVGPKGGVHAATMGLQAAFGEQRVFDTSLSEEGQSVLHSADCSLFLKSSFASTPIPRPSSSTTAEPCGGELTTGSRRRSSCGCPAVMRRNAATPGTASVARCCGPTLPAGRCAFLPTRKTPWAFSAPRFAAMTPRFSSSTGRCSMPPRLGGRTPVTSS